MESFTKLVSIRNYISGIASGKIAFPKSSLGRKIRVNDGEAFIFRQAIYTKTKTPTQDVLLHVNFTLHRMSPRMNRLVSLLTIPVFIGLPGFHAKFWCLNRTTEEYHGFYVWESKEHAEAYVNSFAMEFMKGRSVPGSVGYEIMPLLENKYDVYPDIL